MATKPIKPTKPTKPAETPKVEQPEPEATEKKVRGPRQDYGIRNGATISLTDKEVKYRGKRLEYFEILKKFNGKTIEKFYAACPEGDPPRGWLRFFVQDGAVELEGGQEPDESEAKVGKAKKAA